jgi:hypothetical protein
MSFNNTGPGPFQMGHEFERQNKEIRDRQKKNQKQYESDFLKKNNSKTRPYKT